MTILSGTWLDLLGLSGFLNPIALVIGAYMGWKADQPAKLAIAGFAGAILSLFLETGWRAVGLPPLFAFEAGALALFPFRFAGAGILATAIYFWARSRRRESS